MLSYTMKRIALLLPAFALTFASKATDTIKNEQYRLPELPALSIVKNSGEWYAGIGGTVKATLGYDFGHVLNNANDFVVADIPTVQAKGDGGLFHASAQQTELYITAGWRSGTKYGVETFINGYFLGDNYSFELENAWLKFLGFKAGYGYGILCPPDAMPSTIDHEGPNGALSVSNAIFDYSCNLNSNWSFSAGIELPVEGATYGPYTRSVNKRIPDIPVAVDFCKSNVNLRCALIWRGLQYRDKIAEKNHTNSAYGASIIGYGSISGPLGFCFQTTVGRGITSYYQDLNGADLDMIPSGWRDGKMKCVKSWGGYWGLSYAFSQKVSANLMYSHLRIYPKSVEGDTYRYGQYVAANLFCNIIGNLQWGLEYIYGRRVNIDASQGHDSRIQTMLAFSF